MVVEAVSSPGSGVASIETIGGDFLRRRISTRLTASLCSQVEKASDPSGRDGTILRDLQGKLREIEVILTYYLNTGGWGTVVPVSPRSRRRCALRKYLAMGWSRRLPWEWRTMLVTASSTARVIDLHGREPQDLCQTLNCSAHNREQPGDWRTAPTSKIELLGRRTFAPDHCLLSAEEKFSSAIWAAFLAKSYVALRFPPKKRTF